MEWKQAAKWGEGQAGIYTSPSMPNMHMGVSEVIPKQLQFELGKLWDFLFSDKPK